MAREPVKDLGPSHPAPSRGRLILKGVGCVALMGLTLWLLYEPVKNLGLPSFRRLLIAAMILVPTALIARRCSLWGAYGFGLVLTFLEATPLGYAAFIVLFVMIPVWLGGVLYRTIKAACRSDAKPPGCRETVTR